MAANGNGAIVAVGLIFIGILAAITVARRTFKLAACLAAQSGR